MSYVLKDKPPVPFHGLDNGLAAAMYRELRLLRDLLKETLEDLLEHNPTDAQVDALIQNYLDEVNRG